jgi:hypothetical protein
MQWPDVTQNVENWLLMPRLSGISKWQRKSVNARNMGWSHPKQKNLTMYDLVMVFVYLMVPFTMRTLIRDILSGFNHKDWPRNTTKSGLKCLKGNKIIMRVKVGKLSTIYSDFQFVFGRDMVSNFVLRSTCDDNPN